MVRVISIMRMITRGLFSLDPRGMTSLTVVECLRNVSQKQATPVSHRGQPDRHGELFGYALDGFGMYAFWDVGGAKPVVDECGGHFGPVRDDDPETVR
jgi:hypothetical protein